MIESENGPEQESNLGKEYPSNLMIGIYACFTLTSVAGAIVENTIQPWFVALNKNGQLAGYEKHLLDNLLNNVGDVTNGFAFGVFAIIGEYVMRGLKKASPEEYLALLDQIQKMLPFLLCTLMWIMILDVETFQISKSIIGQIGVGEADLKDIPAGLYGLLAGSVFYTVLKKMFLANKAEQTDTTT